MLASGVAVRFPSSAIADPWPQYRGPNQDGISREIIRTNWTSVPPEVVWRVPLGAGLSSLSIADGRVLTLVKRSTNGAPRECVVALEAATGRELWATDFDTASYPNGGVGTDDGPRSTPTIDGDYVYAFGAYLKLVCLRVSDGSVVWTRDFASGSDLGSTVIAWQNAASPLLEGDLIFVNCNAPSGGRLMAVRKTDGSEVWRVQTNDHMTQATPILATLDGVRQVIFFAQSGMVALAPETGALLWRYGMSYSTSTAASPVVAGDRLYASAAYGTGAGLVLPTLSGTQFVASEVWRQRGAFQNHWATPVFLNGHLYGIFGQSILTLQCVDIAPDPPVTTWSESGFGYGSVLGVNGLLLALSETGNLVLIQPDPTEYREVTQFKALTGKCWNAPAISEGRIYVRSTLQAVCLDVSLAAPLLIQTTQLPGGVQGSVYSAELAATGGVPPYVWSLTPESGPLPEGVTLAEGGLFAGTPTEPGTFGITVRVTDDAKADTEKDFTITVAEVLIELSLVPQDPAGITQNGFRFQFESPAPGTYVVEWSTNLVEWVELTRMENTGGPQEVHDAGAASVSSRLYRVRR